MTVWLIDEPGCDAYARFVDRHPDATLYHTQAWGDALAAESGCEPLYLAAMRGDDVAAVFPLFEQRDIWRRRRMLSLPMTPAAGLLKNTFSCTSTSFGPPPEELNGLARRPGSLPQ